jgi:hypothetical protein
MIAWLENELDRDARPYTPPPGLHRLNRTEYANSIRDLLDLPIDPAKYLPSDDSTSGFDNIAGALGISSTLVEAYVAAAQKIGRLAVGEPEDPTLVVYRTREDTSQDYHVDGLPFGTRGGLLVEHLFPSDGRYFAGSIGRSSRSRIEFAYSVRLRRCRPGGGAYGLASRSSSFSNHAIIASKVAGSGRRMSIGGIMPARSLRATSSQVLASRRTFAVSRVSSVRFFAESSPMALTRSLWQP